MRDIKVIENGVLQLFSGNRSSHKKQTSGRLWPLNSFFHVFVCFVGSLFFCALFYILCLSFFVYLFLFICFSIVFVFIFLWGGGVKRITYTSS